MWLGHLHSSVFCCKRRTNININTIKSITDYFVFKCSFPICSNLINGRFPACIMNPLITLKSQTCRLYDVGVHTWSRSSICSAVASITLEHCLTENDVAMPMSSQSESRQNLRGSLKNYGCRETPICHIKVKLAILCLITPYSQENIIEFLGLHLCLENYTS